MTAFSLEPQVRIELTTATNGDSPTLRGSRDFPLTASHQSPLGAPETAPNRNIGSNTDATEHPPRTTLARLFPRLAVRLRLLRAGLV